MILLPLKCDLKEKQQNEVPTLSKCRHTIGPHFAAHANTHTHTHSVCSCSDYDECCVGVCTCEQECLCQVNSYHLAVIPHTHLKLYSLSL